MQDYGQEYMPYMQMMGVSPQSYPMATMPADQLESMYPQVYYKMYPMIQAQCNMMMAQTPAFTPTPEQLEAMAEDISVKTEQEMDGMPQRDFEGAEDRQFGYGRRRFLRDLASILLIRELVGRRRRPFYGYPYGYGYGYGFPGYGYPGFF